MDLTIYSVMYFIVITERDIPYSDTFTSHHNIHPGTGAEQEQGGGWPSFPGKSSIRPCPGRIPLTNFKNRIFTLYWRIIFYQCMFLLPCS